MKSVLHAGTKPQALTASAKSCQSLAPRAASATWHPKGPNDWRKDLKVSDEMIHLSIWSNWVRIRNLRQYWIFTSIFGKSRMGLDGSEWHFHQPEMTEGFPGTSACFWQAMPSKSQHHSIMLPVILWSSGPTIPTSDYCVQTNPALSLLLADASMENERRKGESSCRSSLQLLRLHLERFCIRKFTKLNFFADWGCALQHQQTKSVTKVLFMEEILH